jgi:hypothetical protein
MGLQNREKLAHFISNADNGTFNRLALGFTELSSSLNAQKSEKTYINDTTDVVTTSYQKSWSVNGDVYTEDAANEMLYSLAYNQLKGDDAIVYMLVAKKWVVDPDRPNEYPGYKQKCNWTPDNDGGGSGGENITYSGTLDAKGDPVFGWVTEIPNATDPTKPSTATFSLTLSVLPDPVI